MLVSNIPPAPSACILRPHSSASMPVALRPPWVYTCQRNGSLPGTRFASQGAADELGPAPAPPAGGHPARGKGPAARPPCGGGGAAVVGGPARPRAFAAPTAAKRV